MLLSCDPSHLRAGFTVGVRTDSEGGHIVDWLADIYGTAELRNWGHNSQYFHVRHEGSRGAFENWTYTHILRDA